jgi:hypothetical protein
MFCKITNENENHYGFQYVDGLNILDKPFQEKGSCVPGGLYYTDEDNLHYFYEYGVWIRIVSIPEDAKVVEDRDYITGRKWRTDKIIFHDKYPLYSLETVKKFNLKINKEYIKEVSRLGKVDILEWWVNSDNYDQELIHISILYASFNGKINVLDFWKNSGHLSKFNYSIEYINMASSYNQIEVLNWWKNSGLPIIYSYHAMDYASSGNNINILDWWLNSGLELKYRDALNWASVCGNINILDWWLNSGLELKYDLDIKERVKYCSKGDIYGWTRGSMCFPCDHKDWRTHIMNWWDKHVFNVKTK